MCTQQKHWQVRFRRCCILFLFAMERFNDNAHCNFVRNKANGHCGVHQSAAAVEGPEQPSGPSQVLRLMPSNEVVETVDADLTDPG